MLGQGQIPIAITRGLGAYGGCAYADSGISAFLNKCTSQVLDLNIIQDSEVYLLP